MTDLLRAAGVATLSLALFAAPASAQTTLPTNPSPAESGQSRNPAEPTVSAYPSAAAGDGTGTGGYNLSRWAEDWRRYADPAKRDDPLDRLKFLPLDNDGDVYLTLSGELRLRVNEVTNPNLRSGEAQRQDINRLVAGADLHVGPHLRAYGEVAHAGISGQNIGTPAANLENGLVIQQAFVEGDATVAGVEFGARYGRQEFTDGSNLLTSQRDNNTIRFVLNGLRGWARGKTLRADVFDLKYTTFGTGGPGDDVTDHGHRFSGVTAGVVVPTDWFGTSKLYLDPFVWRLRSTNTVWGATSGREVRDYYGARLWGDVDRVTLDWTVNHQGGTFNGQKIDAWQVLMAQTWRLGAKSTAPRIGFHADYASGGGSYTGGTLRNSFAPFGNNIYYSYALFLTPTNLIALAPNVTFSPHKKLRITGEYQLAWRDDVRDAVYRANGSAFAGTQNVSASKIADVARLQLVYSYSPRLSFTGRYEHLAAGPSLTHAGYASSDFLAGWVSFRF
ncbi:MULTISPECIES: alginate export family protein [unclassified Sphingomonas]|uniref:alginate export family protein n=1 Tax=unclassified Sphingomonas TaxID=196159 RepID=UPI002269FEB4|nr:MULTISPECIES: alginate export family protein [unclassified Sphingomonas]